jgi:hypothetical protein
MLGHWGRDSALRQWGLAKSGGAKGATKRAIVAVAHAPCVPWWHSCHHRAAPETGRREESQRGSQERAPRPSVGFSRKRDFYSQCNPPPFRRWSFSRLPKRLRQARRPVPLAAQTIDVTWWDRRFRLSLAVVPAFFGNLLGPEPERSAIINIRIEEFFCLARRAPNARCEATEIR